MSAVVYPLGHTPLELDRLDSQAMLLADPLLGQFASQSTKCLEIGCGSGSNLSLLRQANTSLNYVGIDIAPQAIANAASKYADDSKTNFMVMDGSSVNEPDGRFDLVFTQLVLWSVGPNWIDVIQESYRLLAPGGIFYALEPCNQFIEFQPDKPAAKAWMKSWDTAAIGKGLDPYIGTKVAGSLNQVGFCNVSAKFHPVISLGHNQKRYMAIIENLKGFYMGPAANLFELQVGGKQKSDALAELDTFQAGDLVMDSLFVTWGVKP